MEKDNCEGHVKEIGYRKSTQILGVLLMNLLILVQGAVIHMPSIIIPAVTHANSSDLDQVVSHEESSWIATPLNMGAVGGALIVTSVGERFGRKRMLLLAGILYATSIALTSISPTLWVMCIARFLGGVGLTPAKVTSIAYTCEICHTDLRGALGGLYLIFISIGGSMLMFLGTFLHWRWCLRIILIPCTIVIAGLIMLPDSPMWLLSRYRNDEAKKALTFYRGARYVSLDKELTAMRDTLISPTKEEKQPSITEVVKSKVFYKPFSILLPLSLLFELSGVIVVLVYIVTVFQMTHCPIDPYLAGFLATLARLVGSLFGPFLLHHYPRRILLLVCCFIMALCNGSVAFYAFAIERSLWAEYTEYLNYLPFVSIVVFQIAWCSGYGPVMFLLCGELLPPEGRLIGGSILFGIQVCFSCIYLMYLPVLMHSVGISGVFGMTAIANIAYAVIAFTGLPETKGKTMNEIKALFE